MKKDSGIFRNENFVDLSLYQFGYEECEPSYFFGPVIRYHFLFHYIISGKGRLISTDDRGLESEHNLERSHGFMICPNQRNFYIADKKEPWIYAWVEFDGLKASELVNQAGLNLNSPIYTSSNDEEREKMKNALLYIVKNKNAPPLSLIGHLYLFISSLIESSSHRKHITGGSLRDFYVRESLNFIEQHYQDQIGVEDIATFCNLDRSYLCKIFKSVLNASPQEFLIQYRINKSLELMRITDHSIGEISCMVGYQNQFNFSRVFKQLKGKSPREWRNMNRRLPINKIDTLK